MGLTENQIQERWDANFWAVQDAMRAVEEAREGWAAACAAVTAYYQRPGFRRKQLLGHLTPDEADVLIAVEDARGAAYEAVVAAKAELEEAQRVFKAGVPEEDD